MRNNEIDEHTVFCYSVRMEWGHTYYPGIQCVENIHIINMCDVRGNSLCDTISNCKDHLTYKWYHFLGPNNKIKYYLKKYEIDYVNIHRKSIDNCKNQITTSKWMKGPYNNMGQHFGMLKTFCMRSQCDAHAPRWMPNIL